MKLMKKIIERKNFWWGFVFILFLATLLRFYRLGSIPHGMTWDEAAIGYNGFAIFNTRRDEWLERLPVSFKSFGDFKAPLAIYLNGFFTALVGLNLWGVRLPFTLAALAAIAGMMLLVRKISSAELALGAGLMMTLSPWHLHYSRAGFESGLALSFFIWALYFLLTYLKTQKSSKLANFWNLSLGVFTAAAAIYAYHSAKIVVPLVIVSLFIYYHKNVFSKIKELAGAGIVGMCLLWSMMVDSINGQGLERLGTTILDEFTGIELVTTIFRQFLLHLSPIFLIFGETTTLRHGDGHWGVLLPTTFILAILGLILGLIKLYRHQRASELFILGCFIVLCGLIPAALGEEVPHSNRALLALPGFIFLAMSGIESLFDLIKKSKLNQKVCGSHGEKNTILKAVFGIIILAHGLFFMSYFSAYLNTFARESAPDFKDGYLEAFEFVKPYEKDVEKILFSSDYGQPYIYALFVRKTNPLWYQGGSLIKYEFTDKITSGDLNRENAVVVGSDQDELEPNLADKLIYGSDGKIRFKIYLPQRQ